MRYEVMVNRKHVIKLILTFLLMVGITITSGITVRAEEDLLKYQPKEGLVKVEGVPEYTDEQFNSAPMRITVFTASWCTYCKELKKELPDAIYSKFSNNLVAIRVWEIDSPKVREYFEKFAEANKIQSEFRSQIPFIFINEKYPYLGYSEEISNEISEDIRAIFSEMEPPHGGNLNREESTDGGVFNKDVKNNIEKVKGNQEDKIYFIKAGFLDNFKFIFMLVFSILYLSILSISKNNKYILFFTYFIGILAFNVLTLIYKTPFLLEDAYVKGLKISLYIASAVISFEVVVSLLTGSIERGESKLISILTKILDSKFMYFIAMILGFLVMNSQASIGNSAYISILGSISSGKVTAGDIANVFLYSLSLVIVSIVITLCIRIIRSFIRKDRDIKPYI